MCYHRILQLEISTVYGFCLKICISLLLFSPKMYKISIDRFPVIMEAQDAGFYARSDILFFLMRKEGIKEKKKQREMKTYDTA